MRISRANVKKLRNKAKADLTATGELAGKFDMDFETLVQIMDGKKVDITPVQNQKVLDYIASPQYFNDPTEHIEEEESKVETTLWKSTQKVDRPALLSELVEAGYSVVEMAEHLGCTQQTVYNNLKRHGIRNPSQVEEEEGPAVVSLEGVQEEIVEDEIPPNTCDEGSKYIQRYGNEEYRIDMFERVIFDYVNFAKKFGSILELHEPIGNPCHWVPKLMQMRKHFPYDVREFDDCIVFYDTERMSVWGRKNGIRCVVPKRKQLASFYKVVLSDLMIDPERPMKELLMDIAVALMGSNIHYKYLNTDLDVALEYQTMAERFGIPTARPRSNPRLKDVKVPFGTGLTTDGMDDGELEELKHEQNNKGGLSQVRLEDLVAEIKRRGATAVDLKF